jgi:hypothetical protein
MSIHEVKDSVVGTPAPTDAMEWTVRTYTLESTPDSSIPLLAVDDFEDSL